ncbi:MAG: repeat-containing protein [Caulobacteraceae bacterium]|nr:repeat-containing protein [Caulobacteraceae bacterium]
MKRTSGPSALPGLSPARAEQPVPFLGAFSPAVLFQTARQAHQAGRPDEAEQGYRRVLQITPRDANVLAHLGTLMLERGRWEEGVGVLDACLAVDPRQQAMLTNRGNALIELGRFEDALASYQAAIDLEPDAAKPGAYNNLGAYLQSLGRSQEAVQAYDRAIALEPDTAEAWGNRGIGLTSLGRYDEALAALDRALALNPGYVDAMTNRGIAFYLAGRMEEALAAYRQALAMKRDGAEILSNMALALQALDRLDEALACCDQAIGLNPDFAEGLVNRGMVLQAQARFDEAVAAYDRAMAIAPDFADPYWNKALVLLLQGDFEAGGQLYERRWDRTDAPPSPAVGDVPLWLGQTPVAGKTILLHGEQGLGDTIQMLRYAPLVAAQGARVALSVQPGLIELAQRIRGVDRIVDAGTAADGVDLHCPLMSLPLALGTTLPTIPAEVPYLAAPAAKRTEWAARLGPATRPRIGLAWSGNRDHKNDRNRSMALETLLPLLAKDTDYISLQREYRPADQALMAADGRIRDVADQLESFTDTAALIEHLDLVVSVDTSAAHLAGALGKPLFVLLPWVPDHRWLLERDDSPWYPTARLFRQQRSGDWSGPLEALAAALG